MALRGIQARLTESFGYLDGSPRDLVHLCPEADPEITLCGHPRGGQAAIVLPAAAGARRDWMARQATCRRCLIIWARG